MRKRWCWSGLALMLVVAMVILIAPASFAQAKDQPTNKDLPVWWNKLSATGQVKWANVNHYWPLRNPFHNGTAPRVRKPAKSGAHDEKACVNILVNNPPYVGYYSGYYYGYTDTQSETTITLAGNNRVLVGYNDSSWAGLAYPWDARFTSWARSDNSGASFYDATYLGVPLPWTPLGDAGDPCLSRDPYAQRVYLSTLAYYDMWTVNLFRSSNDGISFGDVQNCMPGWQGAFVELDKPWIKVDDFAGPGQGNIYAACRAFSLGVDGIRFTVSKDQGATFSPNQGILLADDEGIYNVQGANIVVGKDHAVYVFYLDETNRFSTLPALPGGYVRNICMRKSTTQGASWGPITRVSPDLMNENDFYNGDLDITWISDGANGDYTFRTNTFPQGAVNRANGQLYVVYNDYTVYDLDHPEEGTGIYMVTSMNGGSSWSAPVRIDNDTTSHMDKWQPTLAVTPDGMRIFVGWYDRRLDYNDNWMINNFGRIGTINKYTGAITWGPDFLITTSDYPPVFGVDVAVNPYYMGDYDQATADTNYFYYSWGDNRLIDFYNGHNPDVRMAKIPVQGPGGVLARGRYNIPTSTSGAIYPNTCNVVTVPLCNYGTRTVYGINATLMSSTPGVTIVRPTVGYPDLPIGACATNTGILGFLVQTDATLVAGTPITFVMQVQTSYEGTFNFSWTVPTGNLIQYAFPTTTAMPLTIPDTNTFVHADFTVAGLTLPVNKVEVSLQITHPKRSDLYMELDDQYLNWVVLSEFNGDTNGASPLGYGSSCTNRTIFDDNATTSIMTTSNTTSFSGRYRPMAQLQYWAGMPIADANGPWYLYIRDVYTHTGAAGVLNCATLYIYSGFTAPAGTGPCPTSPTYDMPPAFDDFSRSAVCADGLTGKYRFTTHPVGGPVNYYGIGSVVYFDPVMPELVLRSAPGNPQKFQYHLAGTYCAANFQYGSAAAALVDSNTLDSLWVCP